MDNMDNSSSSFNAKEEDTSHSLAESDDKYDKSINQNSEANDSEVERSDNDNDNESINDDHVENENKSDNDNESIHVENGNKSDNDNESIHAENENKSDNDNENKSDNDNERITINQDEENSNDSNIHKDDNDSSIHNDDDDEINEKLKKKKKETDEIFGDSDSENDEPSINKRKFEDSGNEDSEEEFFSKKKKSSSMIKESDNDQSDSDNERIKKKKRIVDDDDDEDDDDDDEEGKQQKDEEGKQQKEEEKGIDDDDKVLPDISSSSSSDELEDDDRSSSKRGGDLMYDFDIMMAKKKEQNARNRKRRNVDLINDSDDFIADLLNQMKQAAEDDFELNKNRKAATRKMKLLPTVQIYLRKIDLKESFLDSGVLSVITDWLTPLPDRSLPNLQVRETMLKILLELNIMDVDRLKSSSIGKAVMYLFKHPKETKENKRRAAQLISNWSRPIFNCETDYQSISKEDREQRDYDLMTKVHKRKNDESTTSSQTLENQTILRPGDKGWVPRARVPAPSTKDYVVRPKSTVEIEFGKSSSSKKPVSRLDKHLRTFAEKKRSSKMQRAVKISIEGRKL